MRKARAVIAVIAATVALTACSPGGSDAAPSTAPHVTLEPVTALFVGDSYTEGVGLASPRQERWSALVAADQAWTEVNAGCSGSGYTRQGLLCGTTFEERLASLTNIQPDVVIIWGGVNDAGGAPDDAAKAAADTITAYARAFPDADLIVLNAMYFASAEPEPLAAINAALSDVALRSSAQWVDVGPLLADEPNFIGDDGLHPNAAGHRAIADAVLAALDKGD